MKRRALAFLAVLAACGPRTLLVPMNAENNSGQKGTATFTEVSSTSTKVEIEIRRVPDPTVTRQPVHIHPGRCGEIDARLMGEGEGLPDMQAPEAFGKTSDGGTLMTEATVTVPFKELTKGTYVVNVHDARDFGLYTSCGNIN